MQTCALKHEACQTTKRNCLPFCSKLTQPAGPYSCAAPELQSCNSAAKHRADCVHKHKAGRGPTSHPCCSLPGIHRLQRHTSTGRSGRAKQGSQALGRRRGGSTCLQPPQQLLVCVTDNAARRSAALCCTSRGCSHLQPAWPLALSPPDSLQAACVLLMTRLT